jgi:D-alanyl-lipoteichoic acid acyltransferase DltB (MBOAT superfamily)
LLFHSPVFVFLFLPVCLAGFYGLGRLDRRAAGLWLVLCSLTFYGWWDPSSVPLLAATVLFNYAFGRMIARTAKRPQLQSTLLGIGVAADLALLGYCKYLAPLLQDLGALHWIAAGTTVDAPLPLGVSFFTITQIMYLIDCQQRAASERRLLDFALFGTFFPNLISGPIVHRHEVMPQFTAPETYRLKAENLSVGMTIFVLGLGKKALLADPIAPYADAGFRQPDTLQLFGAWGACLAFALQLYFDFSGYSDMAIGLARMFGIRLPLNFASPYKAASIIDYWQRWNMTLTRFFTLYLYNPLALRIARRRAARNIATGRNAAPGAFMTTVAFPTFVTMSAIGIWHGAGLQFLCFGLLHAAYITANHIWRSFGSKRRNNKTARSGLTGQVRRGAAVLATFLAVVVAQAFFRAASTDAAIDMVAALFGLHGLSWPGWELPMTATRTSIAGWPQIALLLGIVWAFPNTQEIMANYEPALDPVQASAWSWLAWRPSWPWAIVIGLIFIFSIEGISRSRSFLYFQF